jgi:hypothetical protein
VSDPTVLGMSLGDFLAWLVKFGLTTVEPLVAQAIEDWSNNKITAEEADAVAEGKFSAMLADLQDPRAESAKLDAETEKMLHDKFDHTDATKTADPIKPPIGDEKEPEN